MDNKMFDIKNDIARVKEVVIFDVDAAVVAARLYPECTAIEALLRLRKGIVDEGGSLRDFKKDCRDC